MGARPTKFDFKPKDHWSRLAEAPRSRREFEGRQRPRSRGRKVFTSSRNGGGRRGCWGPMRSFSICVSTPGAQAWLHAVIHGRTCLASMCWIGQSALHCARAKGTQITRIANLRICAYSRRRRSPIAGMQSRQDHGRCELAAKLCWADRLGFFSNRRPGLPGRDTAQGFIACIHFTPPRRIEDVCLLTAGGTRSRSIRNARQWEESDLPGARPPYHVIRHLHSAGTLGAAGVSKVRTFLKHGCRRPRQPQTRRRSTFWKSQPERNLETAHRLSSPVGFQPFVQAGRSTRGKHTGERAFVHTLNGDGDFAVRGDGLVFALLRQKLQQADGSVAPSKVFLQPWWAHAH